MTCKARYRGLRPVFGIDKKETYTLGLTTEPSMEGNEYIWVSVKEIPEYLMPYESIVALVTDWDFTVGGGTSYVDHLYLSDEWLSVYKPSEVTI